MAQEPTEKEISTTLEKLTVTYDLKNNGESTETSSLIKPKILYDIDRIKLQVQRRYQKNTSMIVLLFVSVSLTFSGIIAILI